MKNTENKKNAIIVSEPLNRLITEVKKDTGTGRNGVCFRVVDKKGGGVNATRHHPQGKGILSPSGLSLGLFKGAKKSTRYIRIAAGQTVDMPQMNVRCEDVQSEVEYTIALRFDMQTPDKDNHSALQKLVEVFADTIPKIGSHGQSDGDSGPNHRFRSEMQQWLTTRYRSGDRIKTSSDWRLTQAKEIEAFIAREYGLDTKVKLTIRTVSEKRLKPVDALISTNACDSKIDISIPIKIGCELVDGNKDLFEAETLSKDDLKELVERRADRFVRDNVTLQQFRFESAWVDDLQAVIEKDLQSKGRTISYFYLEHSSASAEYGMGPFEVKTDPVDFTPAGWGEKDKISFISNAQVSVNDAAIHEKLFDKSKFAPRDIKGYLHEWFTNALGAAIHECLHRIHDNKVGYATLLTDWDNEFQKNIKARLEGMAKDAGLKADAIISNPERPEVKLPQGVWIYIPEQIGEALASPDDDGGFAIKKFASMTPSVNFELAIDAHIKIDSFSDEKIRDILNQTTDALAFIRTQLIEPAVRRVCQTTDMIRYYTAFEFAPEELKGPSFTEKVRQEVEAILRRHNITLLSLLLRRADGHISQIYSCLTGHVPERIEFQIDPLVRGREIGDVSGAVPVGFDLNITGIREDGAGWGQFVPLIWPEEVQEAQSYYDMVYTKVAETISAKFQAGDMDIIRAAEIDADGKKAFARVLTEYVNDILDENFGLSGKVISIKRGLSDQELIYAKTRAQAVELKERSMQAEQAKAMQRLDADVKLAGVQEAARIQDARDDMDARMPGDDLGAGSAPKIANFDDLDFDPSSPKPEDPKQGADETPQPEGDVPPEEDVPPEDDIYEMPSEDDGKR